MGQRKKQARAKKRAKHSGATRPRQSMRAGPFWAEQHDSGILQGLDTKHPDFAEFQRALREEIARTPTAVQELRSSISDAAAGHHAFDVISAVWMSTGMVRPGALQSYHPEVPTSTAAYVAHVLLERDSPDPLRETTPGDMQGGVAVESMANAVRQIFQRLPAYFALRQGAGQGTLDPYLDLRTKLYAHHLAVSSFAYEWQERKTLERLFEPFAEDLRAALGFAADEAINLSAALGQLQLLRMRELGDIARRGADEMKRRVSERRAGKTTGEDDEYIRRLADMSPKAANRWMERTAMLYMAVHMGRHAAFTAQELADDAKVDRSAAQAFLDAFAVEFGHATLSAHAVGGEIADMRRRPIVHDGQGRYLPAAVDSVLYGLRDVMTDGLKDHRAWKRFTRHRARDLEERALVALASALEADWHHAGVKYWYRADDGTLAEGEADGVLRADTLVVLVEAKAGSMTARGRSAEPRRLERALRDLIVAAHDQLRRSEAVLVRGTAEKVTDAHGTPLTLDLDGVTRILRIAVSLEDLSAVAPAVWQLGDVGLLPSEELAPWTVGIHELELICAMVERPAQLSHYILRRLRTYRQRIWGMDEMDFWMRYLSHGLWWEDDEIEDRLVEVHSHTDPMDAWAYGERGLRPKAKRPRQKLDRRTRSLLDAIAATGAAGRLEAQLMLLEMSSETRQRVTGELQRTLQRSKQDGEIHRSSFVFGEDMAVTVEGVPSGRARNSPPALTERGLDLFDEHGLRRWLGLSATIGSSRILTGMAVLSEPRRLGEV